MNIREATRESGLSFFVLIYKQTNYNVTFLAKFVKYMQHIYVNS